jgi:hypothetical protein
MDFKVGDVYKCPEGHRASIVWISENENVIAVKCPYEHFEKIEKVNNKERKIYNKDVVFLIEI